LNRNNRRLIASDGYKDISGGHFGAHWPGNDGLEGHAMNFQKLEDNLDALVSDWMSGRAERMARRVLDPVDFSRLATAGLTLTGVPAELGGLWRGATQSARPVAMLLRKLARVDPSLALVITMHPTVLLMWMIEPADGGPSGWKEHQRDVLGLASAGHWFGTVASEPGIGGDILATKATAKQRADGDWSMTGDKFMGSGSGMSSFMMTVAVPAGEERPDIFLVDMRDLPWDGSRGLKLVRAWDGIGMAATQSHAFRFDDVRVTRHGLKGGALDQLPQIAPVIGFMFSAVFIGILDAAAAEAKRVLGRRAQHLTAIEQTSWVKAQNEIWLAQQAFEGMVRSLESQSAGEDVLHGKLAIADLCETALSGLAHAVGGASLSQSSPFGQWMQDVRALGYLRPPRALSYTRLFNGLVQ
jgi:alkylation response protein AidB-like acyl-CoA dehydrogenase